MEVNGKLRAITDLLSEGNDLKIQRRAAECTSQLVQLAEKKKELFL